MTHARSTRFSHALFSRALAATSILLAPAVLTLPAHAFDAATAAATAIDTSRQFASVAGAALSEGYRAAPALMLGLALAISLPFLTVLSRVLQAVTRSPDATRRYRPGRDDNYNAEVADRRNARGGQPFVEIEAGAKGIRCAIPRDMLRIGREDDNDIRIPSGSVHRYHAAIHREDYDDWHITDLSGVEGNGLIVNGRRCCEARLSDGDVIQLGPGRLRFRAGVA